MAAPAGVVIVVAVFDVGCIALFVAVAFNPMRLRDRLLDGQSHARPSASIVFGVLPGSMAPEAVVYLSTVICGLGFLFATSLLVWLVGLSSLAGRPGIDGEPRPRLQLG